MTQRLSIRWDQEVDAEILADLDLYQARSRGRRVRELILLGLRTERAGLAYLDAVLTRAPSASASPVPVETSEMVVPEPVVVGPAVSSDHQKGLDDLLDAFGIE